MSAAQQNKYINQLGRQLVNAIERIKTLELYLEPEGRITAAFDAMERPIAEKFAAIDKRFERLQHQFNRLEAKIEVVLEAITGLGDLPEDDLLSKNAPNYLTNALRFGTLREV
jgi:hypothetical protein